MLSEGCAGVDNIFSLRDGMFHCQSSRVALDRMIIAPTWSSII